MTCKEMILSEECVELIAKDIILQEWKYNAEDEYCIHNVDEYLNIFYSPKLYQKSINITNYPYASIPKCYTVFDERASGGTNKNDLLILDETGILSVQQAPYSLKGNKVICAFIDTGIKYQDRIFQNEDGTTRIIAIWDQTIQSGREPEGFLYGSEYRREDINEALDNSNPLAIVPTNDELGHGSDMAAIASGSVIGNGYFFVGAAPECDIAVVKLKQAKNYLKNYYGIENNTNCYMETDIIQAVQYLQQLATKEKRPIVISIGVGTSFGEHAGLSLLAQYINRIAQMPEKIIIVPTGNEAGKSHHTQGILSNSPQNIEMKVSEKTTNFVLEIWGGMANLFQVNIKSPSGEIIQDVSRKLKVQYTYRFVLENTTVMIDSEIPEAESGEQLVRMKFETPAAGLWTVTISANGISDQAIYNAWLPMSELLTGEVIFLTPNPYITLTSPSTAYNVLSVTAYAESNYSFYPPAGRGYTENSNIKPDIAAPGDEIRTLSGVIMGTAIAAAIVVGAAAQYLQWAVVSGNIPLANTLTAKNFFIRGAIRKSSVPVPSKEFGWGALNIENSFRQYLI